MKVRLEFSKFFSLGLGSVVFLLNDNVLNRSKYEFFLWLVMTHAGTSCLISVDLMILIS